MIDLIIIVILSLAAAAFFLLFLFERSRSRYIDVEVPRLLLRLEVPGRERQWIKLPLVPFSCGFSREYDLNLQEFISRTEGRAGGAGSLMITPADGRLRIDSSHKLMVNGVERRSAELAEGKLLRFRGIKIKYLGIEREQQRRKIPAPSYAGFRLLIPSLLLFLSIIVVGLWRPMQSAETMNVMENPSSPEVPKPPGEPRDQTILQQFGPDEELPRTIVDLLFIHAHPDDESIDFGTLLASAQNSGLATAVLLLTDGEAGIFSQKYDGVRQNLPRIRVVEAAEAMRLLGVDYYLRAGLPNHPYNGVDEEISVDEVLSSWGGREKLVNYLSGIIGHFKPIVLISPDKHSAAREHFEHEATGLLVAAALSKLQSSNGYRPAAHLISVDPRQKGHYGGLLALPRKGALDRQRAALLSHRTQADASIFGVEMIEEFGDEYYHVNFWSLNETPLEYLLR